MLMRERSGALSLFGRFAIGNPSAGLAGRIKTAPPPLKERGADISEPREGSSLGGYLAKLTISAAVTTVTRYRFHFLDMGRTTRPSGAALFCQRWPECYRVQKVSVPRAR